MNFMDILAARAEQDEGPSFPLPEAQRDELALFLKAHAASREFKRGDLVQWKHKAGPVKSDKRGLIVFMFWRMLDTSKPADAKRIDEMDEAEMATIPDPDCIICNDQQGTTVFQIAEAAMLEFVS